MVKGYFGCPGCGKTCILTAIAQKELKRISRGKSPYNAVYTNFPCVGCKPINFTELSVYNIEHSLILLDEITLDADNRDFKSFPKGALEFFVLHRHSYNDIVWASQHFDAVDKKIKNVTQTLYYCRSSVVPILRNFTVAKQIYREFTINEYQAEPLYGYRFAGFAEILFAHPRQTYYRPRFYKFYDSHDRLALGNRPMLPNRVEYDHSIFE